MRTLFLATLLIGCSGKDETSTDDTDVQETDSVDTDVAVEAPLVLSDVITITEVAKGDFTCQPTAGTWRTQAVTPACIATVPIDGDVEDFQSGDGVSGLKVELWLDDDLTGDPDVTMTSGENGKVSGGDAPTCTPWTSRVTDSLGDTLPTIQQHWSDGPGTPMGAYFNSVSSSSLALITTLLGVTPDLTKGVIAGTAYDCVGGGGGLMEGVQVIVRAEDGTYPGSQDIKYFVDEFPDRTQPQTTADGLWMIINVPPGRVTVETYAVLSEGAEPTLIAQTKVQVFAGSLVVADVYTGTEDGVRMPASCEASCVVEAGPVEAEAGLR